MILVIKCNVTVSLISLIFLRMEKRIFGLCTLRSYYQKQKSTVTERSYLIIQY